MKKLSLTIGAILLVVLGWFFTAKPEPPFGAVIKDDLKLKAPVSSLLGSRQFTHVDKDKDRKKIAGTEKQAVKYAYKASLVSDLPNEIVAKRDKWSRTFTAGKDSKGKDQFITEIIAGEPQYYHDTDGSWWFANYATTSLDAFNQQVVQVPLPQKVASWFIKIAHADCASPCTFYPDPNVETNTVDGSVYYVVEDTLFWAGIHDGTGGGADDTSAGDALFLWSSQTNQNAKWDRMYRLVFGFNTGSSIPAGANISLAVFSLAGRGVANKSQWAQTVKIDRNPPATATALVAGDYNVTGWTGTSLSDTTITDSTFDSTTGTYNNWTLNASGIAQIALGSGITWLGARFSSDFNNIEPTWVNAQKSEIYFYMADQAGTTTDPKLVITYTAGGAVLPPSQDDSIFY